MTEHHDDTPKEGRALIKRRLPAVSLRVRLVLLVLLGIVPALLLMLLTAVDMRRQAIERAHRDAFGVISSASSQFNQAINEAHQLLILLSRLPAVRSHDAKAMDSLFSGLLAEYPMYSTLLAYDPNGRLFASTLPWRSSVTAADRPYFQRLLKTRDFVVGDYEIGHVSHKPILVCAYPVLAGGRVKEVLAAGLSLDWLNRLGWRSRLPSGSILLVVDRSGTILVREPDPKAWVGKTLPDRSLIQRILKNHSGSMTEVGLDGVQRLYTFSPLGVSSGSPNAYLCIGIQSKAVFARGDAIVIRNLAVMAGVALFALLVAWFGGGWIILRRLNPLLRVSRRLGRGELAARSGVPHSGDEIGQLAGAFDEMAAALEILTRRHELLLTSAAEGIPSAVSRS